MMGKNDSAALKTLDGTIMPLVGVKAQGILAGALFEMTVEQRYCNEYSINIEAIYTFPLARGAVMLGIEFELNGTTLSGIAVEKNQAEQRYEAAIEDGDSAILLEKSGDGLYTVNLGNLNAGEEAVVRYRYAQLLAWEQGCLRLTIPTTIAPRYGDPRHQALLPHQIPIEDVVVEYPLLFEIDVLGEFAYRPISSPTHAMTSQLIDGGMRLTLGQASLDRDVVLTVSGGDHSIVHVARDAAGWVALAAYCPTIDGIDADTPVSLRVVIDCSGSMGGLSIQSARQGALSVIEGLQPQDEFTVTRFGSDHTHLFDELVPADTKHVNMATHYLHGTEADMGGTEMALALESASQLSGKIPGGIVLLITDGEIWDVDNVIETAQRSGLRYFVVGIGMSPAHEALARLATETGGGYEAVAPGEDVAAVVIRQFGRMRQPRARHLRLIWPQASQWMTELPVSLFKGDTVHVFAGFTREPEGRVRLLYTLDDGTTLEERADVQVWTSDAETLARLGTAMRIQQNPTKPDTVKSLTDLAVRYNLVTDYTHYVVVQERSESDKPDDLPRAVKVRQMMAAGWGGMPLDRPTIWRNRRSTEVIEHLSMMDMDRPTIWRNRASGGVNTHESIDTMSWLVAKSVTEPTSIRSNRNPDKNTVQPRGFITPKGQVSQFLANLDQRLNARRRGGIPTRVRVLATLGLPLECVKAIEDLIGVETSEERVVLSFFKAILDMGWIHGISANGRAKLEEALKDDSKTDHVVVMHLWSYLETLQA